MRTTGRPTQLADAVRSAVWQIDPSVPVRSFATMQQRLFEELDHPRFVLRLVMTFSLIALGLAALGVYAVLAYAVAQRTREFGVRIALGARGRDVMRDVLSRALTFVVAGGLAGAATAIAVGRILSSLLHGVAPLDPVSVVLAAALLGAAAMVASYLPARRATRISPLDALRVD